MKTIHITVLLLFLLALSFQSFSQGISVHDPVMIRQNDTYYLFCTGMGISVWSSTDMKEWKKENNVFTEAPDWAVEAVPGFRGHIWAPDITFFNGQYYLYYSVSAFGKNTSCIGVATNKTLDSADPDFQWVDHGKVIQSIPGKTNWNAIDPNFILDETEHPYLTFGSFWDGLKLVKLTPNALTVNDNLETLPTIASRKERPETSRSPSPDSNAGPNAIEAPFVFKRGDYYYLFASIDYCCRGANSTYKMIVGRSRKLTGPFVDQEGKSMALGGGTIVLAGNEKWHGVGHNAVVSYDGTDYLVFHGYDANENGRSRLLIEKIAWDKKGWPAVSLKQD
ncbi:MAG: arabinan endo-1,5-alpha-L-arabinosidase [Bacteroidales bacterium]|nr:arabinan endo-1,5-alpha-L-arabinosidase [Bacteroidales bacterium]